MYVDLEEDSQDGEVIVAVNPIDALAKHDKCWEEIPDIEAKVENCGSESRGRRESDNSEDGDFGEMERVWRQDTLSNADPTYERHLTAMSIKRSLSILSTTVSLLMRTQDPTNADSCCEECGERDYYSVEGEATSADGEHENSINTNFFGCYRVQLFLRCVMGQNKDLIQTQRGLDPYIRRT